MANLEDKVSDTVVLLLALTLIVFLIWLYFKSKGLNIPAAIKSALTALWASISALVPSSLQGAPITGGIGGGNVPNGSTSGWGTDPSGAAQIQTGAYAF